MASKICRRLPVTPTSTTSTPNAELRGSFPGVTSGEPRPSPGSWGALCVGEAPDPARAPWIPAVGLELRPSPLLPPGPPRGLVRPLQETHGPQATGSHPSDCPTVSGEGADWGRWLASCSSPPSRVGEPPRLHALGRRWDPSAAAGASQPQRSATPPSPALAVAAAVPRQVGAFP